MVQKLKPLPGQIILSAALNWLINTAASYQPSNGLPVRLPEYTGTRV